MEMLYPCATEKNKSFSNGFSPQVLPSSFIWVVFVTQVTIYYHFHTKYNMNYWLAFIRQTLPAFFPCFILSIAFNHTLVHYIILVIAFFHSPTRMASPRPENRQFVGFAVVSQAKPAPDSIHWPKTEWRHSQCRLKVNTASYLSMTEWLCCIRHLADTNWIIYFFLQDLKGESSHKKSDPFSTWEQGDNMALLSPEVPWPGQFIKTAALPEAGLSATSGKRGKVSSALEWGRGRDREQKLPHCASEGFTWEGTPINLSYKTHVLPVGPDVLHWMSLLSLQLLQVSLLHQGLSLTWPKWPLAQGCRFRKGFKYELLTRAQARWPSVSGTHRQLRQVLSTRPSMWSPFPGHPTAIH